MGDCRPKSGVDPNHPRQIPQSHAYMTPRYCITSTSPHHLHPHSLYRSTLATCSPPNSHVDHLDDIPFPQINGSYRILGPPNLSTFNGGGGGGGPGKVVSPPRALPNMVTP
jgi:hypothetical protein